MSDEESGSDFMFEICCIPKFINIDILKKYVNMDIESNIEYYEDMNITYKISNCTKTEWMIHKSIKMSEMIGSGNNWADVSIKNSIFIDVSVLTLNQNITNEKSINQNFIDNNKLDELFNETNGNAIVNIFKKV